MAAQVSGRRWSGRDVLLPIQIALCCLLVTSSLVAVRGLMHSFQTPLGFAPDGVAVAGFDVGLAGYDQAPGRLFQERVLERIAPFPGVDSASYFSFLPLTLDPSPLT